MYNILICDDQPDIVNALMIYLSPEGYRLFEAFNGREALEMMESDRDGYYRVELDTLLRPYLPLLGTEAPNNLFFTTSALRNYHYAKHKENAYYHLQAINLPFQNIEFMRIAMPPWLAERIEKDGL